jgi:hypothetical protein
MGLPDFRRNIVSPPSGSTEDKDLVPLSLGWSELILCTEVCWVDELVVGVEKLGMFGREEKCMIEKPEGRGGGGSDIGTGRGIILSGI